MTPADFLNEIVIPNVAALSDNVGDLRLAVNAVLTLDALAGVIHADLCKRGLEAPDDAAFATRSCPSSSSAPVTTGKSTIVTEAANVVMVRFLL